ncbi:hypothetical protein FRB98_005143 [Tulasnella sp. 332]|nr:hypothetical protein FRB98_005143 [Tulasnella sp. 332]
MTSALAKEAKDKGNAAFKSGDHAAAVGQYSAAIVADRTDPTLPLNRAAAYLKLGKNEDAERDCSTVLALPAGKNNVKALFRRAQARIAVGKLSEARNDLKAALVLEPGNESVKAELTNLESSNASISARTSKLTSQRVENTANSSYSHTTAPSAKPYRRRVPITIVDGPASSKAPSISASSASHATSRIATLPKADSLMSPVSSRSIKSSDPAASEPTEPPPPSTTPVTKSQDPWAARDIPGRRIGGGIIKKGATNYSAPVVSPVAASPSSFGPVPPVASSTLMGSAKPTPRNTSLISQGSVPTLFDFTRTWNMTPSHDEKWNLLKSSVRPSDLPSLFLTSLEPTLLTSILDTFLVVVSVGMLDIKDDVLQYLEAFPTVPRFEFVLMFLNSKEQTAIRDVWALYGQKPGHAVASGWKLL